MFFFLGGGYLRVAPLLKAAQKHPHDLTGPGQKRDTTWHSGISGIQRFTHCQLCLWVLFSCIQPIVPSRTYVYLFLTILFKLL